MFIPPPADTTPPKSVLRGGKRSFMEAGLVPTALLHLGLESPPQVPLLSAAALSSARSAIDADLALALHTRATSQDTGRRDEATATAKTVPKWFRLGK